MYDAIPLPLPLPYRRCYPVNVHVFRVSGHADLADGNERLYNVLYVALDPIYLLRVTVTAGVGVRCACVRMFTLDDKVNRKRF